MREGAAAGWPVGVHAIGDAANTRRARRVRALAGRVARRVGLRQRIEHAQCLDPGRRPTLRGARRRGLGAVHARAFRRAPRKALLGGSPRRHVLVPLARRVGRGRRERLRRAGRGARPVGGRRRRRPRPLARGPAPHASSRRCTRRASRPRGCRTTSARAARSSPAATPTSSSSTATRSRASRRNCARCRSSRRCSAAAGRTTRRPGTEQLQSRGDSFTFAGWSRSSRDGASRMAWGSSPLP